MWGKGPTIVLTLALLVIGLGMLVPVQTVHASATLVRQNNGGNPGCSPHCGSSVSVTLSNLVAGDVLVAGVVSIYSPPSLPLLTDSRGSTFTQAVAISQFGQYAGIFYVPLSSGGSDTVTATFTTDFGGQNLYLYEVSGVTTTGVATGTGSSGGSGGTSLSTSFTSFQSGAFLLGIASLVGSNCPCSQGAGFTLSTDNSGTGLSLTEWSDPVSSPTNFPFTLTNPSSWVEASLALDPTPTVTLNVSPSTLFANQPITFSGQITPGAGHGGDAVGIKVYSGSSCSSGQVASATGTADSSGTYSAVQSVGLTASSYSAIANDFSVGSVFSSPCTTFTVNPTAIPEYSLGLPLLAVLMIIAYGIIRSRTKIPTTI